MQRIDSSTDRPGTMATIDSKRSIESKIPVSPHRNPHKGKPGFNVAKGKAIASAASELFGKDEPTLETTIVHDGTPPADAIPLEVSPSTHVTVTSVGLGCLPGQSRDFYRRKGGRFTLMVAGPSGSGKTTFINTLFGAPLLESKLNHPTSNIEARKFVLAEQGFQIEFTAIDTTGFGQAIDNRFSWSPITNFIDEQFRLHLFQSEQPNRTKLVDSRVHCCIYFLGSCNGALTPLDIATMKELSQRVNVIPVISKSDTYSREELCNLKKLVRDSLIIHNISVCDLITDTQVVENINQLVPFALIGSQKHHTNQQGKLVIGRKYKWGISEVENDHHCDFLAIRKILMSENMLDLVTSTESHYENYRRKCLAGRLSEVIKKDPALAYNSEEPNGLEELLLYTQSGLQEQTDLLTSTYPRYEILEREAKKEFESVISIQEKRFKDWKRALVSKQDKLNSDINVLHQYLIKLKSQIDQISTSDGSLDFSDHSKLDSDSFSPIETSSLRDSELVFN